jgi:sortase A
MLSRVLGWLGRSMVVAGLFILGFVGFQLWGTGLQTSRSQDQLAAEISTDLSEAPAAGRTGVDATTDPELLAKDLAAAATVPAVATPAPSAGQPVGIIQIPKIDLARVVVQGVSKSDLKKGPGHYGGTALPGQPGNAAIAGHRTTYGAPFNRIDELVPGDEIVTTTPQGQFTYKVRAAPDGTGRGWFTVKPSGVLVLAPTQTNQLTLTACHPKYSARQRIVVVADLVTPVAPASPPPARPPKVVTDQPTLAGDSSQLLLAVAFALGAVAVGMAAWFVGTRWKKWPTYVIAAPFVLVLVWFSWTYLDRYLPAL